MLRQTILVVEDDPAIRRGLVDALTFAGYGVLESGDGRSGLSMAIESSIDLVLLDVMLPHKNGFDVLAELRQACPGLPIVMITARGAEDDRVRGLGGGADDYVVKPFSAREVLARIEAVLRRSAERPYAVTQLSSTHLTINLERREVVMSDGSTRQLSDREAGILRYLAAHRGRAVDRRELLHRVWGLDPRGLETRTVDMHVARLREKLGDNPDQPHVIRTVRAKGYMLGESVTVDSS